jgi:hypothetical protein
MSVRRLFALGAFVALFTMSACGIGPKQDDPLEDRATDSGLALDSGVFGGNGDTAAPGVDATTTPGEDVGTSTDTSVADPDATDASDASDAIDAPVEAGDADDAAAEDGG